MTKSVLGIVGGSGFYNFPGLDNPRWQTVVSPWGAPSDEILFAEIGGLPVRFLPRHGRGHRISPTDINYRANIDCLKRAGVTDLVSISACGSLKKKYPPGDFVLPDQFIDRTFAREKSFFGTGCVAHVAMGDPVSPLLVKAIAGIDDRYRFDGNVTLTISGDGKQLLSENLAGSKQVNIDLDLHGVRRLEILVDYGEDKVGYGDYLNLCNARLMK